MKHMTSVAAVFGVVALSVTAMPHAANAWWRGGVGVGVWLPPVVVAPPPVVYSPPPLFYAPPPAYYPAPRRIWVPPHWQGPYWVPGHWA